jgi:hypothetical protein
MERPRINSFAALLRSSSQLYSDKAAILFLINFLIIVPMLAVVSLLAEILPHIKSSLDPARVMALQIVFLVLYVLFAVATLVSSGALLVYIARSMRGQKVSSLSAYQATLGRFGEFFKVNVIYALKMLAGCILLLLPGIYFGIVHVFAPFLVLVEGMSAKEAMAHSKNMVSARIFVYTDYLLFAALTAIASSIPFIVILNYLIDWSMFHNHWRLAAAVDFATMCVALMVTQFILVFYVRLYEELKTQPS